MNRNITIDIHERTYISIHLWLFHAWMMHGEAKQSR